MPEPRYPVPVAGPRPTNPRPAWSPDLREQLQACRGELATVLSELSTCQADLMKCRADLNALQVEGIVCEALAAGKLLPAVREFAVCLGLRDRATLLSLINGTLPSDQ